jgi:hypothetical protein
MRQRRGPIAALLVFVLASLFSTTFRAQQNGVKRPLTLAELTYGESINAMTPASGGDIWIGGYTCSATLPTTSGAIQRTWSGEPCVSAGLLARMKRDGTIGYLSYWGGSGLTQITSLATDASGYLYIGGWTQSSDFETTPGAFDSTCPET